MWHKFIILCLQVVCNHDSLLILFMVDCQGYRYIVNISSLLLNLMDAAIVCCAPIVLIEYIFLKA